jgi:peptidoglycan/LPS O-acetylase OafA/YrhL
MASLRQPGGRLAYRRDIDGLRAVAVLLVVFNHLRTRFSGGYIGVDVFFVISGYLISAVILSDISESKFSIVSFYERRIRRIFPALLVMLLTVSVMAYRYLAPSEVESYGRSMLAALFSGSNFLFWHQAGYFDGPSELKPLLHTWSLAVEEQFYIIFPIFLIAVRRWIPGRLKTAIWTLTGISFAAACFWVLRDSVGAFFFAPLRAWELLIGTILSQRYLPPIEGSIRRNIASLAGILLILVPALGYTAQTTFPGLTALAPCVGAGLIIAAGETGSSVIGSMLSWQPVVFVGLISYSLYLWHWPILVFQRTSSAFLSGAANEKYAKYLVFVLSLVIATLSWRFVETPFRKGRFKPGRKALFVVNGITVTTIAAVGIGMILAHGIPSRFPADAQKVAQYADYDSSAAYRENVCFIGPDSTFADYHQSLCLKNDPSRKHYLLLGDSHAAHLYPGLSTVFPEINFSQSNHSGCLPLTANVDPKSDCGRMNSLIFGDYLLHNKVDAVLLAGRWADRDMADLGRTIAWLQQRGFEVILFGPVIEFDTPLPRLLATLLRDHNTAALKDHREAYPEEVDKAMNKLARDEWKVRYISAYADLCADQVEVQAKSQLETASGCPVYAAPGVPLLFDTDHFTAEGSVLFARAMRDRNQMP